MDLNVGYWYWVFLSVLDIVFVLSGHPDWLKSWTTGSFYSAFFGITDNADEWLL
jgi:hypothetical protein